MSDSDEPDWVVEQASADKRVARAPSSSGESPSVAGDEPPEVPDDASDLWSGDDKPVQEEDDEEEEEEAEPVASQASPGAKPKPKSSKAPPASRLPFVLPPKVRRDLLVLESTDSTLDLSGDSGTIGRLRVHSQAQSLSAAAGSAQAAHGEHALTLDLKGKVFDGDVVPCNTLCIVSIDGKQAKVEAVCSDFVRLGAPRGSIFDMETVQEGDFGDDFFDDIDDGGHSNDDEEELGPLKEGKAKSSGKTKAKAGSKAKSKPKGKVRGRKLEPRTRRSHSRAGDAAPMPPPCHAPRTSARTNASGGAAPAFYCYNSEPLRLCLGRRAAAAAASPSGQLRLPKALQPRRPSFEH